jgi:transposase-like protein
MAEMVVNGVSTRKVSKVVETLCGTSISKSAVSDLCKDLDKAVEEFRNRPLTDCYPLVTVDATYFKVREDHRVISKAMMIAYATNSKGIRDIIGFGVYPSETKDTWTDFLTNLRGRGLHDVRMFTSDSHEGIKYAISHIFPDTPWQRCQFHFSRNVSDKAPKNYQAGIRGDLNEMFNCKTLEDARKVRDRMLDEYGSVASAAMECLENGFEDAMTVMALPRWLRKYFRTSNHIERLNEELKRRSDVIGIFPNESSILRLMGSVLIEKHDALQAKKTIFNAATLDALLKSEAPERLMAVAEKQVKRMTA